MLYIMLSGSQPFNGTQEQIRNQQQDDLVVFPGEVWSNISTKAKDLVLKLMKYNDEERLSAADALKHEWIKQEVEREELA